MTTDAPAPTPIETVSTEPTSAVETVQTNVEQPASDAAPSNTDTTAAPTPDTASTTDVAPEKDEKTGFWPDEWRDRAAGDDKSFLKQLERFSSPEDLVKAYRDIQKKISTGEYKKPLPKDATPEETATWRKENGIPDAAERYDLNLPKGANFADGDEPMLNTFRESALGANLTNAQFNNVLEWYFKETTQQQQARQEEDTAHAQQAEDLLREEWGGDYRKNVYAVQSLLATGPEGLADLFANGRLADGTLIGDNPKIMKWLSGIQREINPAATFVPAGTTNAPQHVASRIESIEKMMKEDFTKYQADDSLQKEYRDLLGVSNKLKAIGQI